MHNYYRLILMKTKTIIIIPSLQRICACAHIHLCVAKCKELEFAVNTSCSQCAQTTSAQQLPRCSGRVRPRHLRKPVNLSRVRWIILSIITSNQNKIPLSLFFCYFSVHFLLAFVKQSLFLLYFAWKGRRKMPINRFCCVSMTSAIHKINYKFAVAHKI